MIIMYESTSPRVIFTIKPIIWQNYYIILLRIVPSQSIIKQLKYQLLQLFTNVIQIMILFAINGSLENPKCFKIQQKNLDDQNLNNYLYKLGQQIQSISLTSNRITSKGIQYLSQRNFCNLAELFLNRNNLGNLGCKMISKSNWPQLKYLSLSQNRIDSIGVSHLSKGQFKKLKILVLMRNNIGNDGIKKFNKGIFLNLESLSLTDKFVNPRDPDIRNNIEFWEAVRLVLSQFDKLRLIWLNCSGLTDQNINELKILMKDKLPNASVMMR